MEGRVRVTAAGDRFAPRGGDFGAGWLRVRASSPYGGQRLGVAGMECRALPVLPYLAAPRRGGGKGNPDWSARLGIFPV